jgi:hypothetical protein
MALKVVSTEEKGKNEGRSFSYTATRLPHAPGARAQTKEA